MPLRTAPSQARRMSATTAHCSSRTRGSQRLPGQLFFRAGPLATGAALPRLAKAEPSGEPAAALFWGVAISALQPKGVGGLFGEAVVDHLLERQRLLQAGAELHGHHLVPGFLR